jgi:hypothetical protein
LGIGLDLVKNIEQNKLKLNITFTDPKAIEIVENLPKDQRDTIIEKYVILGDMVVSHASITTSKERVEEFFAPLRQDIETIRTQLNRIVPTVMTPASKGEVTVGSIFESFKEHFMDDSFEDVSSIGRYSDILATTNSGTPVLIELKDYTNAVPSTEIDKFWNDMEVRNAHYGIFISMRSNITKCSTCINLQHHMNRTAVFVVNNELNWKGHLFAFYVVKKLLELETTKSKELSKKEITGILKKVHDTIQRIKKLSEDIDDVNATVDELKTLSTKRLDKITSIINVYRRNLDEIIEKGLEELEGVKI